MATEYFEFTPEDLADIKHAKDLLEHPGIAARLTNTLGVPIQKGFEHLPVKWRETIGEATTGALTTGLRAAVATMNGKQQRASHDRWHMFAVGVSGLSGGFGLAALPFELPISTIIMLRSIADIARSEGEHAGDAATVLACMQVLALGGRHRQEDGAHMSSYFAARAAMARAVTEALEYLVGKVPLDLGAPALVRFIASIASRFSITVSEKAAAMAVPVIGAAGGVVVNTLFMDHFQNMAHGHFTVRRLERKYGEEKVKAAYEA